MTSDVWENQASSAEDDRFGFTLEDQPGDQDLRDGVDRLDEDLSGAPGVVDVETKAKNSSGKRTTSIVLALVAALSIGVVYAIGSKVMSIISPQPESRTMAGEMTPLDAAPPAAQNPGVPSGPEGQPPMTSGVGAVAGAPAGIVGQPADAMINPGQSSPQGFHPDSNPGGQPPLVAAPGGQPVMVQPPVGQVGMVAAPPGVGPDGRPLGVPPSSAGAPAVAAPAMAQAGVPQQAFDRVSAENAELKGRVQDQELKIAELTSLLDKARTAAPASSPAKPRAVKSSEPRATRQASTSSAPKKQVAKKSATVIDEPSSAAGRALLSSFKIYSIYPNSGDHLSAHVVDSLGRGHVVRVGETIKGTGARVTKIDPDSWRVQTTDGEIR